MQNIKNWIVGIAGISLVGLIHFYGLKNTPNYVPEGRIGFSENKPIESKGFYLCSAAILDLGDSAVYAHVRPTDETETVQKMIDYAKNNKISLENSFAIINAGMESSMSALSNAFTANGVRAEIANTNLCLESRNMNGRKVNYDPVKNMLTISRGIEKRVITVE